MGIFVANRVRKETEQVIGYFMNTIVLHNRIDPKSTFRQLIRRVAKAFHAALANQELPFEALARVLEREHNIRRSDLFPVMFIYNKRSPDALNLSGMKVAPLGWRPPVTDSDLTLTACDMMINMWELKEEIRGTVKIKRDVIGNDVVSEVSTQLTQLLREMVAGMERKTRVIAWQN